MKNLVGHRVSRIDKLVEPILANDNAKNANKVFSLWECGTVVSVNGDMAKVKVYRDMLWEYPVDKLEINVNQEEKIKELSFDYVKE